MGTAKVVSLKSRPSQVSQLSFEVDGILGAMNAQLGASASAFDFGTFYATLSAAPTATGDASRLLYNAGEIQTFVQPNTLASLRAEPRKAALNKAITARQNAYFSKYGSIGAIVTQVNQWYSPGVADSKSFRLQTLSNIATSQFNLLSAAYASDGRQGVVKTTNSVLNSTTESNESTSEQGASTETGINDELSESAQVSPQLLPNLPPAGQSMAGSGFGGGPNTGMEDAETSTFAKTTSSQTSQSRGEATEKQTIVNTDYGYRTPYYESMAQNERAQISLIDQQFSQFMYSQQLPHLTQILYNELASIDNDVYRLQIAFLNTILLSPFAGTVTGVYKNPGDAVRAGEPVVRIENNATVLLVGTLIYRGLIALGSSVSVATSLYGAAGASTTITGTVVAARGNQSDDDQWDVVLSCDNVGPGGVEVLPIGYRFDYDDTVVTVT